MLARNYAICKARKRKGMQGKQRKLHLFLRLFVSAADDIDVATTMAAAVPAIVFAGSLSFAPEMYGNVPKSLKT